MTRCCMCRTMSVDYCGGNNLEPTDLPGTGFRCVDRHACADRIRYLIDTHKSLAEVCDQ